MAVRLTTLLNAVTVAGAGTKEFAPAKGRRSIQVKGSTSAGAGTATVLLEVSNDRVNWAIAVTLSLVLGTTETSDQNTIDNSFAFVRGNVTALTGTGAKVTLILGD